MAGFFFNGRVYEIPQALSKIDVILNVGAPLPDFGIGLLVGRNVRGPGFNLEGSDPVTAFSMQSAVSAFYGPDSDLATAFKYWTRHGGGTVMCLGAAKTTQSEVRIGTADNNLLLTSKDYGAHTADYAIQITKVPNGENVQFDIAFTPVKNVRFLLADAPANAKGLMVTDAGSLKAGDSIVVVDDLVSTKHTYLIESITRDGARTRINLAQGLDSAVNYADGAHLFQLNDGAVEETGAVTIDPSDPSAGMANLANAINTNTTLFSAVVNGDGFVVDDVTDMEDTEILRFTSSAELTAKGTSPLVEGWGAGTGGSLYDKLPAAIEKNGVRLVCPIITASPLNIYSTPDEVASQTAALANVKASAVGLTSLAVSQRTNNRPIQLVLGAMLGVTDTKTSTDELNPLESTALLPRLHSPPRLWPCFPQARLRIT